MPLHHFFHFRGIIGSYRHGGKNVHLSGPFGKIARLFLGHTHIGDSSDKPTRKCADAR